MYNVWSRRRFLSGAGLLALLLFAAVPASQAQNDKQTRYAIERAQIGVSGKILAARGTNSFQPKAALGIARALGVY